MRKSFDAAASLPEPAPEPWCFVSRETAGEGRGEGGERRSNAITGFNFFIISTANYNQVLVLSDAFYIEDMNFLYPYPYP